MKLTPVQQQMHERAVGLAKRYRRIESELILVLQEIDRCKLFKRLGKRSLFVYATETLDLSESVAYAFISVARKAKEIPVLQSAIRKQEISVSKASRVVSGLNSENAAELLEFAKTHTLKEIDFKIAEGNPEKACRDKITPLSKDHVELRGRIANSTLQKLKRAESLEAQRGNVGKLNELLNSVLDVYLYHKDPVEKAKRAQSKPVKVKIERTQNSGKQSFRSRTPLTAAQKHAVNVRDGGRCTHVDVSGKRCNQDRWTEHHHIIPLNIGGTNEPENLTTLCSFHHDLVHQLSLEIDGQINWLRSPTVEYRIWAAAQSVEELEFARAPRASV